LTTIPIFRQHRDRLELNRLPQGENLNGMSCRALYFKVKSKKNCTVCTIYLMSDQPLSPCRTKTNFTGLAPSCIIRARSCLRFWPEGAALSIAFLSAFSDAGLIGIKFYKKSRPCGRPEFREETPKKCVTAISCCTATYDVLIGTFKAYRCRSGSLPETIHQMTPNPDTRSSRLESLTKMAQAALVEDFNRMVARQAREAVTLSAAV
jgi:hypothetical protein